MCTDKGADVLAIVLADMLTGRARYFPSVEEHEWYVPVLSFLKTLKSKLGSDGYEAIKTEYRPAAHAFADMLFDRVVLGEAREATFAKLRALPVAIRAQVETLANDLTGRGVLNKHRDRWEETLWRLRGLFERIVALSPSGLTAEELRDGFDGTLHSVVDQIMK